MNKLAALLLVGLCSSGAAWSQTDMVQIPVGEYQPFFARGKTETLTIPAFWLDRVPVTNGQFQAFVAANPHWGPHVVPSVFADSHYLDHWSASSPDQDRRPVTLVSWFAAQAYCEFYGKTLPTTDQWEYALADQGRNRNAVRDQILAWYGTPNGIELPVVDRASANGFGIAGLAGRVWEWTLDFNSALAGPDLRNSGDRNKDLFCGGGSLGAKDAGDYAAFMRYAFRSSLKPAYTTGNLGFRCAKEFQP